VDNCFVFCSQPIKGIDSTLLLQAQGGFVIAVDGGLAHLKKMKLLPTLWVGDGDSLKDKRALKSRHPFPAVELPQAKDYSDLEYGLHLAGRSYLEQLWSGDLYIFGAQGGRLDHELGNILVAQRWLQELAASVGPQHCPNIISYGVKGAWAATTRSIEFHQIKGELFSVFSTDPSCVFSIAGAKYEVRKKQFEHASTGLSNEGMGKQVRVEVAPARGTKAGAKGMAPVAVTVFPI
jgi:thiamine pyrophosphokinase